MNQKGSQSEDGLGIFQIVILVLSVVVLGMLVADTAFKLPPEISDILQTVDTLICLVFLIEFGIRFYRAESKLAFLKWGWIDLLASIPYIPILRWGRFVRVLRIIRLIRALRATHKITRLLLKNRFEGGLASVILTSFLLVVFSSIGILICEQSNRDANIKTAGDAIWWSVTTITTVGYGDKYPVTAEGRIVAMILMVSGVGMFGILSGLVASLFIGSHQKKQEQEEKEILKRLQELGDKIDELKGAKH